MKRILIALAVITLALIGVYCTSGGNNATSEDPYAITIKQIQKNMAAGSPLIDVRSLEEYAASHAKGAINLTLEDIQSGKMPDVAKDEIVYVYCHTGIRAGEAKALLEKAGFIHVISLISLDNWVKLGGKTT